MLFSLLATPLLLLCSWGEARQVSKQTEEDLDRCPDHWIDATATGLGCLYFNSSEKVTWEEAADFCQAPENDASLIEIWSEVQLDFVKSKLMFLQDNGVDEDWWTGGTDLGSEGHWYWAESGAPVGDFIWDFLQPMFGDRNNCLGLGSGGFRGYDFRCGVSVYFICQKK